MKHYGREVVQFIRHLFSNIWNWRRVFGFPNQLKRPRRPVVLVPGYTVSYWQLGESTRAELTKRGFDVFVYDAGNTTTKDIRELAAGLSEFVEKICRRYHFSQVSIVAHSMGGVIARYYLQKLNGKERVAKIIAIGTPFRGTTMAYLALHTKAGRMLVYDSSFLQDLNMCTRYLDRIVSIRAKEDEVVRPISSSVVKGAKNIELPIVGHTVLMNHPTVVSLAVKYLM